MEDYTKYKLKSNEELTALLEGQDNLFVIACNKCYKAYDTADEPDADEFAAFAASLGKTVTGIVKEDFLCNAQHTGRLLKEGIPEGAVPVVISCGLGIQTIAGITKVPVVAATNSLNYTGHHGMALTSKACDACAQCYLNMTGGICPIVDCSKSLVNGQCGGAKNGKCEVDPEKDCAWEKIYQRLKKQGRLEEFNNQPVQIRDFNKADVKTITAYVRAIRDQRLDGYYGGIHPTEKKELSEHTGLVRFAEPKVAVIPVSMHLGAPAKPLVSVGDEVKVGQMIAEAGGFISAPVHASISGRVIAVEPRPHVTAGECLSIVIESDGLNTLHESVQPHGSLEELTPDEIIDIVKNAGIVGMGGAGFPTCVKLKPAKPVDTILLNGCECEPMLTADHQLMLNYADDIIFGLKAILKTTGAGKGLIVIEDNKPDAIALLQEKVADIADIDVFPVRVKYPEGAEKTLIKRVTGRIVPSGGLPADVGCIVDNVATVKAIADAIRTGMPLIERIITVTGDRMARPGNYIAKIGTNISDLIDYCGGITPGGEATLKAGGPMMGFVVKNVNIPVMKGSNGIIAFDTEYSTPVDCIKCGRCVDVCPMELLPLEYVKLADEENWQGMADYKVMDCVECRCCEFICSSKIPITSKIKAGKAAIRGMKK